MEVFRIKRKKDGLFLVSDKVKRKKPKFDSIGTFFYTAPNAVCALINGTHLYAADYELVYYVLVQKGMPVTLTSSWSSDRSIHPKIN